ncbi:glycoside hydrolase family 39 [Photorhabdus temperata]|uniref:Glycosyl hydrolase family 39 n=1 Tax=Photorhabdus temperata subsp. temperata Meg1 TaxID=1393735 RepID=A0A081RZN8_PHOTE|nr:glycoside hydrolase family 39 [Photorhabdus temperata]KER04141.1 glycosyl hydrolase family 39 [Photorhabdus temperata subsp. temperata Meg1]MCT8347259.1 glycoside hydrolase family 39 [Photorhabdus temperata]
MTKIFSFNKNRRDLSAGHNSLLKEVNGVNGLPKSLAPGFPDLDDQFNQMGVKHLRIHDCFGIGDMDNYFQADRKNNQNQIIVNAEEENQSAVKKLIADISNIRSIFPYAAAGMRNHDISLALKEANYKMTDAYLRDVMRNQVELNPDNIQRQIMFRIGRSFGGGHEIPQDFDVYATLVGTLVNRYALNYAKIGLPRKITYWQVWNEPDLSMFWNSDDPKKYYELYAKVARIIKSVDPSVKVGSAGIVFVNNALESYVDGFLRYCKDNDVPLDFFSWHGYVETGDPQNILDVGNTVQQSLKTYGFTDAESFCTEWNSCPIGTKNTYTKVQGIKNAAYIASTFIYMQYMKIDRAYYYRGDGLSFGLFNDQSSPKNPHIKNFCTYSAQSFSLFARMFETPYILSGNKDFSTGLTVLATENESGNKINILAANYKVDRSLADGNSAPDYLYQQYYLDTSRSLNKLTDIWSKNKWFGGVDPTTIHPDNAVVQYEVINKIPDDNMLRAKNRNYIDSDQGITVVINHIGYKKFKVKAYRIQEGGTLEQMTPPEVTSQITVSISNNKLTLVDEMAKPSTVTLYSLELSYH